jgi:hypothetical protein
MSLMKITYETLLDKVKYPLDLLDDHFNQNPFKIDLNQKKNQVTPNGYRQNLSMRSTKNFVLKISIYILWING